MNKPPRTDPQPAPRVGFISLGCPKALVDSERILTQLSADGYEIAPTYEDAELVVVNTCGFIDEARAESLQAIGEALDKNGRVIVTGCLGAEPAEIERHYSKLLAITGPQAYEQVMAAVHRHLPPVPRHRFTDLVPPQGVKLTPRHYAYLKISEGCNHRCSFCIIPSLRGDLVSRPPRDVLDEAERLVAAGVRELLVISQDTSAYGVDARYATDFWHGRPVKTQMPALSKALSEFGVWVRLHYVYPYPNVDAIIPLMAEGAILPYLDIPLQHGSPRILKAMRRPAAADDTLKRIERWRADCPELAIRSTFIVGFPGETEADFELLLEFIEAAQLDRVGAFQYSPVEGARANTLPDAVAEELKAERYDRFMRRQAEISRRRLKNKVGTEQTVIIDAVDEHGALGRSMADAPEIDGVVHIAGAAGLTPGKLITVHVERSDEHDLWGRAVTAGEAS